MWALTVLMEGESFRIPQEDCLPTSDKIQIFALHSSLDFNHPRTFVHQNLEIVSRDFNLEIEIDLRSNVQVKFYLIFSRLFDFY